jgi:hypothetical protein
MGCVPDFRQTAEVSETLGGSHQATAQLRAQWGPVIGAVIAAGQDNQEAAAQVEALLAQLAQQDDWRNLAASLRRLLAGERQPETLLAGLDEMDTFIMGEILQGLEAAPAGGRRVLS